MRHIAIQYLNQLRHFSNSTLQTFYIVHALMKTFKALSWLFDKDILKGKKIYNVKKYIVQ